METVYSRDPYNPKTFAFIGIEKTDHGSQIVRTILRSGYRPRFGLIFTHDKDKLEFCQKYWGTHFWNTYVFFRINFAYCNLLNPLIDNEDETIIANIYRKEKIPFLFVPYPDNDISTTILRNGRVDTAFLAEGPILKGKILSSLKYGIVNFHAAPLPEYRGNYSTYWALYHDEPIFVSAHIVIPEVDMGPILMKREVFICMGDNLTDIDKRCIRECGALAVDVLKSGKNIAIPLIVQEEWQGTTYRGQMPADILEELKIRLINGEYSHYTNYE